MTSSEGDVKGWGVAAESSFWKPFYVGFYGGLKARDNIKNQAFYGEGESWLQCLSLREERAVQCLLQGPKKGDRGWHKGYGTGGKFQGIFRVGPTEIMQHLKLDILE